MIRTLLTAAALVCGTAALAPADAAEPTPPGDGITRQGTNPEGQPCTPAGFNQGLEVYRDCIAMGGPVPALEDYPRCSRFVTDRCIQAYTRWTD